VRIRVREGEHRGVTWHGVTWQAIAVPSAKLGVAGCNDMPLLGFHVDVDST
jgi:hypothetical protein